jgi:hypothetical protein
VRLAFAGNRTDTLRVALTALAAALATLAVLAAVTVLAIPELGSSVENPQYSSALIREQGLRPGVVLALALLTIPVLTLAGQCGRLGAPARDRRLAAVRLAGATPGQAVALAAVETGLASTIGVVAGFGAFLVGRQVLDRPEPDGRLPLPTDILPAWPALALVALGLPVAAGLVAAVALRRVTVTPFGVVRRQRRRAPRPWPAFLIVPGVACFAAIHPISQYSDRHGHALPEWVFVALLFLGGLAALVGILFGTGWISHLAGRLLHRWARRPAALLAGRRLLADPWAGSRVFSAVLACVLFGGGAAGMRAWFAADAAFHDERVRRQAAELGSPYLAGYPPGPNETFSLRAMDLVDAAVLVGLSIAALGLLVALAEAIATRRRAHASLVAAGVPRGVLARSVLWQTLAPTVPAVALALTVGLSMTRVLMSDTFGAGDSSLEPGLERQVQFPFANLALFGGGAILAILATTGVALLLLRSSTSTEELQTA